MISYRVAETGAKEKGGDGTAARIRDALTAAGYSVFLDVAHLEGGDEWDLIIQAAVADCEGFIPLVSPTYGDRAESRWTYREYVMADQMQKSIIPVFHSGDYPPKSLRMRMATVNYVPAKGSVRKLSLCSGAAFDSAMKELLAGLRKKGVLPRQQPGATGNQKVTVHAWWSHVNLYGGVAASTALHMPATQCSH